MDRELDSSSLEKFCVHPSFQKQASSQGTKNTHNEEQYWHTLDFHKFIPSDWRFHFQSIESVNYREVDIRIYNHPK